jgi:prevent-host-death family protein
VAKTITATRFKAECLGLLDEVAATGAELIVTKHGRAVVRVVPAGPVDSLEGSVRQLVDDAELIAPIGGAWDAEGR